MSLITKITEVVEILKLVGQLKVALGFGENDSLVDIIKQIEEAKTELTALTEVVTPVATVSQPVGVNS